jgi:dihydrofolate synthase/folylpolyglutamate synthase
MKEQATKVVNDMGGRGADARYAEVEKALLGRLPEHKSVEGRNIERIRLLCSTLADPQHAAPVIHLTGTNGKTTTARMIDSLLTAFGLRTGRLTSPHLAEVRERISLSGEPVSPARFVQTYDEVMPYVDLVDQKVDRPLSFFEVVTALGFAAFADAPVDVSIVEVGLGGEWDSTNVADGKVAVVTPIAVDHAKYLGSTPAEIAVEKAGIIKPGSVAVIAQQEVEVAKVILRRAVEVGATVAREGLEFGVLSRELAVDGQLLTLKGLTGVYEDVYLPLHGAHQAHNAACALAAVEAFLVGGTDEEKGLDADIVREGFANVRSPGRLEVVRTSPTVVLDAAHNPHGAAASAAGVTEAFTFDPLIGVVGMMRDKDVEGVLAAFEPIFARIVCTQNSTMRAMPAAELAAIATEVFGEDRVETVPRLDDAIDTAVRFADEGSRELGQGGVLITGSVITVGEARVLLKGR